MCFSIGSQVGTVVPSSTRQRLSDRAASNWGNKFLEQNVQNRLETNKTPLEIGRNTIASRLAGQQAHNTTLQFGEIVIMNLNYENTFKNSTTIKQIK